MMFEKDDVLYVPQSQLDLAVAHWSVCDELTLAQLQERINAGKIVGVDA